MVILIALMLLLVSVLLIAILAIAFQWVGVIAALLLLSAFVIVVGLFLGRGFILLNEMEIGVIFNKRTENFAYFIDSDVKEPTNRINNYGWKWINDSLHKANPYRHFLIPFSEEKTAIITKGSYKGEGEVEVRTREGIPVIIEFSVSFRLDITQIKSGIEHKMARALPQNAENMIKGKAIHGLRHIVEQTSIIELYHEDAVKTLEEKLRLDVIDRTIAFGVIGISPNNQVQIKSIKMPENIEKALKAAHQRKLQTETVTHALESLRNAIQNFTDNDMARLAELERLRIVDESSASMVYMMDSAVRSRVTETTNNTNGSNSDN
jgi:regulator of protease activity HflC (stomatin/prohibitin superfamily)